MLQYTILRYTKECKLEILGSKYVEADSLSFLHDNEVKVDTKLLHKKYVACDQMLLLPLLAVDTDLKTYLGEQFCMAL